MEKNSQKVYTDKEIYRNRKSIIEYLQKPELIKTTKRLRSTKDDGRCCLGHMMDCLNIDSEYDQITEKYNYFNYNNGYRFDSALVLIEEAMEMLGMFSNGGGIGGAHGETFNDVAMTFMKYKGGEHHSLAELNDQTDMTPQEIGKMLEGMIMGGVGTPWKPITI